MRRACGGRTRERKGAGHLACRYVAAPERAKRDISLTKGDERERSSARSFNPVTAGSIPAIPARSF